MIACLKGDLIYQDENKVVLLTSSGIGYEVHFCKLLNKNDLKVTLYTAHIIRENLQELYGFISLAERKLFQLLVSVKGVGPKSAFSLINNLGPDSVVDSIKFEDKKLLTKAPGIGMKAASQIILDLGDKLAKLGYFENQSKLDSDIFNINSKELGGNNPQKLIMEEAIMAFNDLGFKDDIVLPMAQKVLKENTIKSSEELVHLVLKGI